MDKCLRTWRLTPIKGPKLWSLSSHRGEIWVRAYDAIEARTLTAQRFRVSTRSGGHLGRLESPWYARELTRCEVDKDYRFDSISAPCVLHPVPEAKPASKLPTDEPAIGAPNPSTAAKSAPMPPDIIALDIRQRIVALLLAKGIDAPGHWLDVYAATALDGTPTYVIIPARKLKRFIAEEIVALINRTLDDQEARWALSGEEVENLLAENDTKSRAA